jgi:6-phospho-3-hexuloisomerase
MKVDGFPPGDPAQGTAAVGPLGGTLDEPAPRSQRNLAQAIDLVLAENRRVLEKVDHVRIDEVVEAIVSSNRIFVAGEGRSGLAIRMVAMRLVHLGFHVHVLGETTTPSLRTDDLFMVFSGSGATGTVSMLVSKARSIGAKVVAITTQPDSPVGQSADLVVRIEAAAKQDHSGQVSKQFAGSLFEQATLLLFDALFHVLSRRLEKDPEALWKAHVNVE